MAHLLIPLYAIDVQPNTVTLSPTPTTTFEIGKAMDSDVRNYSTVNNDGGSIKTNYGYLGSMYADLIERFGDDAAWAVYLRLASSAYTFDLGDRGNFVWLGNSTDDIGYNYDELGVYGDGTLGTSGGHDVAYIDSANQKISYSGDGEVVIYSAVTAAYKYHKTFFNCDTLYTYRDTDYRLQHYIDGLLVPLPDTPIERSWSEAFAGGYVKRTPMGKVLPYGFKNHHMRRGRRSWVSMFNEIRESERDIIYECFKVCKGCIPILFMGDETDVGTWSVCKFVSMTEREPNGAGVFFVECEFEEY